MRHGAPWSCRCTRPLLQPLYPLSALAATGNRGQSNCTACAQRHFVAAPPERLDPLLKCMAPLAGMQLDTTSSGNKDRKIMTLMCGHFSFQFSLFCFISFHYFISLVFIILFH
jgi:hypothetical protein